MKRRLRKTPPCVGSLCALFACSCSDPLVWRQDVTELRVIAARVEPVADPSRATLEPGERARVRWLVVDPDGPARVSHGLSACASAPSARGIPKCEGEPAASQTTDAPGDPPTLDFDVPDGDALLLSGVFCSSGAVSLDTSPEDSRCLGDGAQQELATYEVPIASTATPNHHPDLAGLTLLANGAPWPAAGNGAAGAGGAPDDAVDPCASQSALVVAPSERITLELVLPDAARERRPSSAVDVGAWETLQLSHLSTRGRFERPFTVFDADAASLATKIAWRAPSSSGPAFLYLVVRDLRGGVSIDTRAVCVND